MLTFIFAMLLATPLPAKPAQYVTDGAGVLDSTRRSALNEKLAEFERKTSDQILVYVDRRLPEGTTLEEMGAEAIRSWGVGQKGKDNGAILFIFTEDRKMRIETGYGLEGALTDAKSKDILATVVKPHLKDGDYNGAVEDGANAIIATVQGESYAGTGKTFAEQALSSLQKFGMRHIDGIFTALIIGFVLVGSLRKKKRTNPSASSNDASTYDSSSSTSDSWSSSDSSSSSSDWSSSSDSSSSSDFSGGGGSGGGGGASDSW